MDFQRIKEEFLEIGEGGVFRIYKIEQWLLEYSGLYKKTYDFVYNQHLHTDYDGSIIRLPPCGMPSDEQVFINLYKSLNGILILHAKELYFENEMVEYSKIENSPSDVKIWIDRNEYLGAKDYVCFFIDLLDYDKNSREDHLIIYVHNLNEIKIFIHRQDFKNTIDFLEAFNEHYWVRED